MNKWTNAFPLMLQVQHTSQWNLLPAWSCYYLYLVIPSGIETSGLCLPPPSWLLHTQFSSVQLLSCVQLFETPRTAARQASLSITNSWSSLKLMSIELVMPSNHFILCRPLLLLPSIFPSIMVFSNESALCIRWPKYWSFSFNISPSNEHPELISFRMDWLDLLAVQGTLKSLLQCHSSKASVLLHSAFFIVQLSHPYMTTGKTIALTRRTFVGKVMSLLLNMLSRLVITFLPRSKHLLISWLQSPSAVILDSLILDSFAISFTNFNSIFLLLVSFSFISTPPVLIQTCSTFYLDASIASLLVCLPLNVSI